MSICTFARPSIRSILVQQCCALALFPLKYSRNKSIENTKIIRNFLNSDSRTHHHHFTTFYSAPMESLFIMTFHLMLSHQIYLWSIHLYQFSHPSIGISLHFCCHLAELANKLRLLLMVLLF